MSTFHNRSAQLTKPTRLGRWKRICRRERAGLCRARRAPEKFCRFRERERLTRPQYSSSPLDYSLLPDQDSIAQFEQQSHHCREEGGHDNERGENFAVFGPALRPTKIPTETGLNSHRLGDDQS